VTVCNGGGH
jgi:hypothetical protein